MKRSKKHLSLYLAVLIIVGFGLIGQAAAAQPDKANWPKSLIIEGMSVGTSAYMIAAAIGKAIKDELGIRTQVTAGIPPAVSVEKVGKGESHIAYAVGEQPYDAFRGLRKWKGKQFKNLRALTHVVFVPVHFITWPGTGIDSVADLKGKTVMAGSAPNLYFDDFIESVLAANRLTADDLKIIGWREWGEQVAFIRMKLGDAIFLESGVATAPIAELDRTIKWKFVPFKKKEIEAILAKSPIFHAYTIPAVAYTQLKEDFHTVASGHLQVVNANLPDSLVYEICKILFDTPGRFESVHPAWGKFDIRFATIHRSAPYHAGAVKYYKEKGVWGAEVDKWQNEVLKKAGLRK